MQTHFCEKFVAGDDSSYKLGENGMKTAGKCRPDDRNLG